MSQQFDTSSFDEAGDAANQELQKHLEGLSEESKKELRWLAAWWKRWFMSAGHKRLGRLLAALRI